MKRKIVAFLIVPLIMAGCGNAEDVRDISGTAAETTTEEESEGGEAVDITNEAVDDTAASGDSADDTGDAAESGNDTTEDSEGEAEEAPDFDNPVLTPETAELFRDYLLTNLDGGTFNGDECPLYECTFALCDINRDGYMDLVISGYVGIRVAADSLVVFDNGGELKTDVFYGIIERRNENHIFVNSSNYGGAGEEFYTDHAIYSYNQDFTYSHDGHFELGEKYYDPETETEYNPPQQMYVRYTAGIDEWEITADEFYATMLDYGLDEEHILMNYSLTVDNVNMYVRSE